MLPDSSSTTRIAVHFILFLNCLTDPLIYTCSPATITACIARVREYSGTDIGAMVHPASHVSRSVTDMNMVAVNSVATDSAEFKKAANS